MYFQRLEDLRVDNDKTQIEIAEYLNLNRNVYWRYEKGEREIPVWALIKLADYYRVSTDYLLGLTDDPARRGEYWRFSARRLRRALRSRSIY